jgi:hypothetical protein
MTRVRVQKHVATRVFQVLEAWERMRPHKSFFGFNLEMFKLRAKPFLDARNEIAALDSQYAHAISKRDAAAIALIELVQNIVNGVKGDPEEGQDGELYAAMGYVPANQRSTGRVRWRTKGEPPAGGGAA